VFLGIVTNSLQSNKCSHRFFRSEPARIFSTGFFDWIFDWIFPHNSTRIFPTGFFEKRHTLTGFFDWIFIPQQAYCHETDYKKHEQPATLQHPHAPQDSHGQLAKGH
jgi:hypothetical protein